MKKSISVLMLLFVLVQISACTNDGVAAPEPITASISYTNDVAPIISANCIFCHKQPPVNGAPMSLLTKEDVKNAILTRGLLDRISRAQGAQGMMPNGGTRLPQASIDKIVKWQTDGFLD